MTRYFTHSGRFGDDTAYIAISPKRPYLMSVLGKRRVAHSKDSAKELGHALDAVFRGAWKEITAKEARAMILKRPTPPTKD